MRDLGYVREHLDAIEKMARDRGVTLDLAPFREIDTERRRLITSAEQLKAERNKASDEIAKLNRVVHGGIEHLGLSVADAMEQRDALLVKMKVVSEEIKRDDARIAELDERLSQFLLTVPNIPRSSVPRGKGVADDVEVRRWGAPPKFDFAARP